MVKLYAGTNHLIIVLYEDFVVFTRKTSISGWEFERIVKCATDSQKSDDTGIECCAFSPCGKHFGIICDKKIIIYNVSDWNILCDSPGERKASCLQFFPKSNVILFANKSGCAIFYSFFKDKLEKVDRSLGHNSMLTNALITDDEKYVITCDRDEKIRVSNYPNVYNIHQYCLGHTRFITWIGFLPSDKKILVSCSGDGTVKFWNYLTGQQLADFNCKKTNIDDESKGEDKTVITKIAMCEVNSVSILAIVQYKSNSIRILKVTGNLHKSLCVETMIVLSLPYIPWDISFCQDNLVCLLPNKDQPVMVWSTTECKFINDVKYQHIQKYISLQYDSIIKTSQKIIDDIPVLFKREVDNLQEYEKRKKARLMRTGKTS